MRIAFADFCGWDFHAGSVDLVPMGGSQSAACHLARALAREGHEVLLLSSTSSPGRFDGVTCLAWVQTGTDALRSLKLDVMVCILAAGNGVALRQVLGPVTRLILWNQHAPDQPGVQALRNAQERASYDGFAMVSHWQMEQYHRCFGINRWRMAIMRNAMAPAFADCFPGGNPFSAARQGRRCWLIRALPSAVWACSWMHLVLFARRFRMCVCGSIRA